MDQKKQNQVDEVIPGANLYCINGNLLKLIACVLMLCDHVGYVLLDNNNMMRAFGRLAFPIFAFLLAEGFRYTSDIKKYLIRLIIFAFLSEIPFDLCMYGQILEFGHQNVFFTLATGLIAIISLEKGKRQGKLVQAYAITAGCFVLSFLLAFDYSICGILIIIVFYAMTPIYKESDREKRIFEAGKVTILSAIIYFLFYGLKQLYAVFAILPISLYNGKRGKSYFKYVFYGFYPVHLLLIWILKQMFFK